MKYLTGVLISLCFSLSANAAVIEVGDLNIINDAGNASDGLRFLDMTYSVGLTQADALANAQATYADARIATSAEWDDLFDAAGIGYDTATTASGAFEAGDNLVLSSGGLYDGGALALMLGHTETAGGITYIWSDPDGFSGNGSTRDLLRLEGELAQTTQTSAIPPLSFAGHLIVSEVPVPAAAWLFLSAIGGLGALKRYRK